MIILSLTIFFVSGCQNTLTPENALKEASTLTEEDKEVYENLLQAVIDISDANEIATKALESHLDGDLDAEVEYYLEAIEVLEKAQDEMNEIATSDNNQICNTLKLLIAEYQQIVIVTEACIEDYSSENAANYKALMNSSLNTHFSLMLYSQAVANLYALRIYDSLPKEEAKRNIKRYWDYFNFIEEDDEVLPSHLEFIDKNDLYLRWARQFSEELEETEEFNKELQEIRESDRLNPESNEKWLKFCRKYIFNTELDDELDEIYQNLNNLNVV